MKVSDSFDRLSELRDANDFDVVILIWPVISSFDDYAYSEIHSWVQAEARARRLDVIDLLPAMAKAGDYLSYQLSPNDYIHPNGKGHEVGAAVFEDWVRGRATTGQ
jgi:hypothetical protein